MFLFYLLCWGLGCDSYRDEGVHWGIQNGLHLSRSTIVYFRHNDMKSLESILENVTHDNKRAKKLRRYIVVEAVYQVSLHTEIVLAFNVPRVFFFLCFDIFFIWLVSSGNPKSIQLRKIWTAQSIHLNLYLSCLMLSNTFSFNAILDLENFIQVILCNCRILVK